MPETVPAPKLERLRKFPVPSAVLALDAAPDGSVIFAACQDGTVLQVDGESGRHEVLGRHESYASGVVRLPEGGTVISAGYDGTLKWHDVGQRKTVRSVPAHAFWSWDLAASPDGRWVASVTGRYEAGGYQYEPAAEKEPSVKVFSAADGTLRHQFPHVPPVQAVAFSPDGRHLAAANMMGSIRVWDLETGRQAAAWETPDFTSWGIIKSHHYCGGVFALAFSPPGDHLLAAGMGPMRDPMAGNGVQRWQRFAWREGRKLDQTREGESGQGLMEVLAFHPSGRFFVMAGRLFQGSWNLALFDADSGRNLLGVDAQHRITGARWTADGSRLLLGKARQQDKLKDGKWPEYGLIEVHALSGAA